jgi:hypothetical protein
MTSTNQKNFIISNINGLQNSSDLLNSVNINNSIKIPQSAISTNTTLNNSNAGILMKDINSIGFGNFYNLNVNSLETHVPSLYFNNNLLIDSTNLLSELENILQNYPLETSNIIVDGGYINFFNSSGSNINTNQGSNGVGIRYSGNTVQFKNYDTDWIDLYNVTKHDQFSELIDVDVYSNPLRNNQYITYNATSNLFVNSNLAIINDIAPRLGGNLRIGDKLLQFGSDYGRIVYDNSDDIRDNNLLVLNNNTTSTGISNYLQINNADYGVEPSINAQSTIEIDVGLNINTAGAGNLNLNSQDGGNINLNSQDNGNINLNAQQGNIYANTDSLVISGFITNSIYRTSSKPDYIPNVSYTIPLSSDTILFDFVNSSLSGSYLAYVGPGLYDGQKMNIIYNNLGSNVITVTTNFGSNGLITGSGYANGLTFTNSGQSSSLVYLDGGINAWQILNTGSGVY